MLLIVLIVLFVMVMFLWLLSMLGAVPNSPTYSPWLGWFACMILGAVVFLLGSGVIVVQSTAAPVSRY